MRSIDLDFALRIHLGMTRMNYESSGHSFSRKCRT